MIEIVNISKSFGVKQALSNVSFSLKEGEITALIGENGAGKSTLMRIICGFLPQSSGSVSVYQNNIENNRIQLLKHIGYVPEISSLYGTMIVYDFLKWISDIWQLTNVNQKIEKVAKQLKISEVLDERIENLSKGFKKRVEIASAIIHEPKFLILDEPTDGLDPNQKYDIRMFIKQYAKGHIILISTHVLEDVDVANRVIMLSRGKIINDTSIGDFKKVSHHKNLTEAFRILSTSTKDSK